MNDYAETYGTTLHYGAAGAAAATALAGIESIGGLPTQQVGKKEITRIDQASKVKQYAPMMIDPGVLSFVLGFEKTDYATALGMVGVMHSWKITYSDGSTDTFDGFISSLGKTAEKEGEVLVPVEIQVSGEVTFTPAA